MYTRIPKAGTLYTSDSLNLTCVTTFPHYQAVDIPVRVYHYYLCPKGSSVGEDSMEASYLTPEFHSTLSIGSLHSDDSGTHTCSSVVQPLQPSPLIEASVKATSSINIVTSQLSNIQRRGG